MQTPEKKTKTKSNCFLVQFDVCNSQSSAVKYDVSSENLNSYFNITCVPPDSVPLCKFHDNKLRNHLSSVKCSSCKCSLRIGKSYRVSSMTVPVSVINARLQMRKTDDVQNVDKDGILCGSCHVAANRKILTIAEILCELEQDVILLDSGTTLHSEVNKIVKVCLIHVYKEICLLCKNDEAFLLIDMYDFYLHKVSQYELNDLDKDSCLKSAKWLEGMISTKFGNLLEFHRVPSSKQSVLIMYVNLDIKKALHVVMSKSRFTKKKMDAFNSTDEDDADQGTPYPECTGPMMKSTLMQLNDILRDQAIKVREYFTKFPLKVSEIDFDELLKLVDPRVWNAMCVLTMNKTERKYLSSSAFGWDTDYLTFPNTDKLKGQIQFNRRLINIFVLHFIMNDANNYPFQLMNSVIIKQFTHSTQLLQIFNRQGLAVSDDVLQSFLTTVQEQKQKPSGRLGFNNDVFTIVTVDNTDVLSPYATVRQGTDRSWHGTSIMQQQPKPSEKLSHTSELLQSDLVSESGHTSKGIDNVEGEVQNGVVDLDDAELLANSDCLKRCFDTESREIDSYHLPNDEPECKKVKKVCKKPSARKSLSSTSSTRTNVSSDFDIPTFKTFFRDQLKWSFFTISDFEMELISKFKFDILVYVLE